MATLIPSSCEYQFYVTSLDSWRSTFSHTIRTSFLHRHVQISNEGAIDFYKKFGFEIVETKEHYYKRIEPADAHVLQKTLRPRANQTNHQNVN